MPESRNMRLRSKKFEKDGMEGKLATPKKEESKYPVGPWAMAFFAFVILGSTIFQFISMWFSSN